MRIETTLNVHRSGSALLKQENHLLRVQISSNKTHLIRIQLPNTKRNPYLGSKILQMNFNWGSTIPKHWKFRFFQTTWGFTTQKRELKLGTSDFFKRNLLEFAYIKTGESPPRDSLLKQYKQLTATKSPLGSRCLLQPKSLEVHLNLD